MRQSTHRIGLIGNDLDGSLSPSLHQAEAHALGLTRYNYERIDLQNQPDADLGHVLCEALAQGFTGFNVTHPHKQAIMRHLDEISPDAAAIGAVNTVVLQRGRLVGHNTDRSGFLAGLRRGLSPEAQRGTVTLFGAGGAGSAVGAALMDFGVADLQIIDTDLGRLTQLQKLLNTSLRPGQTVSTGTPEQARQWISASHGVVNATPLGMEGIGGAPFDTSWLTGTQWVADVVYRPVITELLHAAQNVGGATVKGTEMLVEQAADTFALLVGTTPDRQRMRASLELLLAAV
ncbi:shikimate dehydrogenase [Glutamicibacter sp. NPDC087344]|uniref:shikimate dehydrogenase n=1 Tax=Glutamicibacter sp. NPDC087344 TaxID=3363994 RepID=UPI0037FE94F8